MVLTFQLLLDCETVLFLLLFSFFYFVFVSFYAIFRRIFRFSSQSHSPEEERRKTNVEESNRERLGGSFALSP